MCKVRVKNLCIDRHPMGEPSTEPRKKIKFLVLFAQASTGSCRLIKDLFLNEYKFAYLLLQGIWKKQVWKTDVSE
jgi:hypothetical protein